MSTSSFIPDRSSFKRTNLPSDDVTPKNCASASSLNGVVIDCVIASSLKIRCVRLDDKLTPRFWECLIWAIDGINGFKNRLNPTKVHSLIVNFKVNKNIYYKRAGALVQWLQEKTHFEEALGSNPRTRCWMVIKLLQNLYSLTEKTKEDAEMGHLKNNI